MKKYIAIILAALMLISITPFRTFAYYGDDYYNYYNEYGDLIVSVMGDDRYPIDGVIVKIYDSYGREVTPRGYGNTYTLPYGYYTVVATYMGVESRETAVVNSSTNYLNLTLSTSNNYKYTFVVNTVDRNGFDIRDLDTRVYDQYDREISSVGGVYTIGYAGKYRVDVYSGYKLVKSAYFDYTDIKSGALTVNIDGGFESADAPRALTDTLKIAKDIRRCGDYGSVSKDLRNKFETSLDTVSNIVDDFKYGKFSYSYNGRYYDKYGKYYNGYYRNYDSYRNGYYYVNGIPYSYYEFYKKFGYYPDEYDKGRGYNYNYTADWYLDKYNGLSMRYYVETLVDAANAVLDDMPISSLCTRDIGHLKYPSIYDYNGFDTIGSYDNKTVKEANELIAEAKKLKDKRNDSYWKKYKDNLEKAIDETNKALKGNGGLKNAVENLRKAIDEAKKNDGKLYTRRAYMKGLTSTTFSPSGTLTRAEMAQIIANLLEQSGKNYSYGTANFSDVSQSAWYYNAVRAASNYGIMVGRPGGKFDPQGLVSKEELIVIAARLGGHEAMNGNTFQIKEHYWSVPYIERALTNGWIEYGQFNPSEKISRGETAKIINKAIGYGADKEYIDKNTNTMTTFDDVDRTNPYYYEILVATNTISYQRTENLRIWRAHVTKNGTWSDSNFGNGDVISPIK